MLGTECPFPDRQRAFVGRFSLGIVALRSTEFSQVIETDGDIRMVGAERLLADRQGAFVERLGLGIAALRTI